MERTSEEPAPKRAKRWPSFLVWFLGMMGFSQIPGWPPAGTLLWTAAVVAAHWYRNRRNASGAMPEWEERSERSGTKQGTNEITCTGGVTTASQAKTYFAQERRKAKRVGSPGYIWRTSRDGAVCERCAANEGRKFSWDKEPVGGHAGAKARCRCYPEPMLP